MRAKAEQYIIDNWGKNWTRTQWDSDDVIDALAEFALDAMIRCCGTNAKNEASNDILPRVSNCKPTGYEKNNLPIKIFNMKKQSKRSTLHLYKLFIRTKRKPKSYIKGCINVPSL